MTKTKAPLGASLIVLSSLFYASYGIWTKLLGNFFGGYTASALRSILVLIILLPAAFFLKKFEPLNLKENWQYILGMIFASLFIWGPLYYAVLHAGVGLALTVAYASIVIGMFFFGWMLAGEKFTRDKALSAVLGIIGLALIFSPATSHLALLALGAAALSGFATAMNTVISKKISYNATQTTVILWLTSVIANTVMLFVVNEALPPTGSHIEWLYLVFFAIASVVASWSLTRGVKLIDAGTAGVLGLLEIVFALIFGVLFFSEKPPLVAVFGAIIIIVASAIPYLKNSK
jgi:drug/metabolite transporter (DMT)-like permease